MEEIALAVYEEEEKSDLLEMLILSGGHNISLIDRADKVFNED